ncbi:MAG: type II toxin-antitoxin system VapC family toxin [Candidatus Andeanibacterium colombiense]|uniref:Type II toxin-antitoxin system VapC family toxin n=1 Tax=Candidatus Andeanibacterium colombiense TaxID=3121345 RepID=A0AAJ5XB93_9SPHN|nr:MAG: type II toxin-antitoxin system VapC family toxin [Sphingomonadaceae bacterium]
MILIDSNVLIDAIEPDSEWYAWSSGQLASIEPTAGFINPIIVREISPRFAEFESLVKVVRFFGLPVREITLEVSWRAGQAHLDWIRHGGRRGSLLPDLLIGAHAAVENARILTRDPRRFRTYFPELELLMPETDND